MHVCSSSYGAWWLDKPTETVDHWTSQTMTGQILETSACQRVGTVLALFKPVCQVSSACSLQNVLRLALPECRLKMLQMLSEIKNLLCGNNATGLLLPFWTPRTILNILVSQCNQCNQKTCQELYHNIFPSTCLLHSDIYTTDVSTSKWSLSHLLSIQLFHSFASGFF